MDASPGLVACRQGPVLTVTLNRPAARNAIDGALLAGLEGALADAAGDEALRVVLLRGADGFFSAGGDLKERARLIAAGRSALVERSSREGKLLARIASLPQIVVAAVEGGAVGLGLGMVAAADLVLAVRPSVFSAPEVTVGAIPAQIAPFVLARLGAGHARRLLLTGATVDADEAFRLGLVHVLHDERTSFDADLALRLDALGRLDPAAVAATRRLLSRALWGDAGYAEAAAESYAALMLERPRRPLTGPRNGRPPRG
jgi:isohexenylglutaconyl-CoA hydratase